MTEPAEPDDYLVDVTKGSLVMKIIQLAWPSVIQAILSNAYAFNDFMFVGHMQDREASATATEALGATVGLQVIMYAFHNCVPSGANTYASQSKGAKDIIGLATIFKSAFSACIVMSTIIATVGYTQIRHVAQMVNASKHVEDAIVDFYSITFLGSPAFGLLLLIDGFFKSNGDTKTPLTLEIASLLINTILNYAMIIRWNWGIRGSAIATVLSRLLPALYGFAKILRGDLGVPISTGIFSSVLAYNMITLGIFESISGLIYGVVFTLMIRLAGELGAEAQAGLGAGLRGLEWIAFCISEGFLVSAAASVGQCIGARMYKRALEAAIACATLSGVCASITGLPFIFYSIQLASILSTDAKIIEYCAEYVKIQGYVMFFVGWEMASFGAYLGAGQAKFMLYINGSLNMARIPIVIACMYRKTDFLNALMWTLGMASKKEGVVPVGNFYCIADVIAGTAVAKAVLFMFTFVYRYANGTYFGDSNLLSQKGSSDGCSESTEYRLVNELDESRSGQVDMSLEADGDIAMTSPSEYLSSSPMHGDDDNGRCDSDTEGNSMHQPAVIVVLESEELGRAG